MTGRVALAVVLVLATAAAAERAATEIAGSVTARRAGAVQVSFEPRTDVRPAVGDPVTFSTELDGIRLDAGQGEVSEVAPASVWVRVSGGRPELGHTAVIRATGRAEGERPSGRPARPLGSREVAMGPDYIDLPETLGALRFEPNPRWPEVMARGGRRLRRPASGWRQVAGEAFWRMVWRPEEGPFFEGPHFRLVTTAVYGSSSGSGFATIGILWYPPGSGGGRCTPPVHRNNRNTGIISQRSDVRVIYKPSVFMAAEKSQPGLAALQAFAQEIFEQLEPFANPCRP